MQPEKEENHKNHSCLPPEDKKVLFLLLAQSIADAIVEEAETGGKTFHDEEE